MKGLKWKHLYLFLACLLWSALACTFISPTVSALGITGGQVLHYQSGAMIGHPSSVVLGQMNKSAEVLWYNFGDVNQWYGFDLRTVEEIPANSLVSFNITFTMTNDSGPVGSLSYNGLQFEDGRTLIFDDCQDASRNFTNYTTWTCSYLYYNPYATYYIQTRGGNHIIEVPQSSSVSVVRNVVIGTPSAIQLTNDGLSASDRAWLESVLPDSTSIGQIEQGVTDALENQSDSERTELEDAQDDASDAAEDSGDEAEAQGQNLVNTVSGFVNGLKNVQASNCVIDIDLSLYHGGTHNSVDLCPQPRNTRVTTILTTVGNILLAIAIIEITVDIIRELIYLWAEAQGQTGGKA